MPRAANTIRQAAAMAGPTIDAIARFVGIEKGNTATLRKSSPRRRTAGLVSFMSGIQVIKQAEQSILSAYSLLTLDVAAIGKAGPVRFEGMGHVVKICKLGTGDL